MILLLEPLSKPVAISEMLLLLAIAALIGWLIGRWLTNGTITALTTEIASVEADLQECRATKSQRVVADPLVPVTAFATKVAPDNLKLIEGIGPKIEQLLNEKGIITFNQLAETSPHVLNEYLRAAGSRFQVHDAGSWPQQAALARDGKWEALKELQDQLLGGRDA